MSRPFHRSPRFRDALRRARRKAAQVRGTRDYFLTDEVADILGTCRALPTTLGVAGRLPAYKVVNGIAVWPAAEVIAFLSCADFQRTARTDAEHKPRRVLRSLREVASGELAPSGTRTRLVLSLLEEGPKNSAELIKLVGPRVGGIIYRLRRQGHHIVSRPIFLVDEFGHPHRGVSLYELQRGGGGPDVEAV